LAGHGPNGTDRPDDYGLYIGNVQNTTFSAMGAGGYFYNSDITITSSASNVIFSEVSGSNAWSGGASGSLSPIATTWQIDPGASGLVFHDTNRQ
jgi:hypothetical protein